MARTCANAHRRRHGIVAAAVLGMAFASGADGALSDLTELPLDQLMNVEVVSASRYAQRASDAPASVTVITAADIRALGYRTLTDVLQGVRSFNTTYDRRFSYAGVRGFSPPGDINTRLLVLVDGYRVNDAIFDAGLVGNESPASDVELIERVEIVRGPSSSVYGSNALFAVINVITRRGADIRGVEVAAEAASFGARRGRLTFGRRFECGLDVLLSSTALRMPGPTLYYPEFSAIDGGVARGTDHERFQKLFAKVSYGSFNLMMAKGLRSKGGLAGAYGTTFNDPDNLSRENGTALELAYYREEGTRQLQARVFRGEIEHDADGPYGSLDAPFRVVNKDQARGKWWGAELRMVETSFRRHKIVAGLEFQDDFRQDQSNYDIEPRVVYLDERHASRRAGFYLQDEFAVARDWTVNAGARVDKITDLQAHVSPRFGLIHAVGERTTVKTLYGTAFRAPNAFESFYAAPGFGVVNPGLRPERIKTLEAIVEHQLQPRTRFTAVAFVYRMQGLIARAIEPVSGLLRYENIEGTQARGAELEVDHLGAGGSRLRASFAHQRAHDGNGDTLQNSPANVAKLNAIVPWLGDRLTAGLEALWQGRRKSIAGEMPSVAVANLTLTWRGSARAPSISASLYNLLDRGYADPVLFDPAVPERGSVPQNGRTFRLKVEHTF